MQREADSLDCEPMKNVKTRSVGAACRPARRGASKALTTLMLCAALALTACGQKRPLQLPQHAKHPPAAAAAPAQPAASAASAPN